MIANSGNIVRVSNYEPDGILEHLEQRGDFFFIKSYRLERCLAYGGFGGAYTAFDENLGGRALVLKCLREEARDKPDIVARFRNELRFMAILRNAKINVDVYGSDNDGPVPYIAMRYIEGEPLHTWVPDEGLGVSRAVKATEKIARLVQRLHSAKVIHRDLNPGNVLIEERPEEPDFLGVAIIDYGAAKYVGPRDNLQSVDSRRGFGALGYFPPDSFKNFQAASLVTDVWSLGAIFLKIFTGENVLQEAQKSDFRAAALEDAQPTAATTVGEPAERFVRTQEAIQASVSRLPSTLRPVLERALKIKANERTPTAALFATELADWLKMERLRTLKRRFAKVGASALALFVAVAAYILPLAEPESWVRIDSPRASFIDGEQDSILVQGEVGPGIDRVEVNGALASLSMGTFHLDWPLPVEPTESLDLQVTGITDGQVVAQTSHLATLDRHPPKLKVLSPDAGRPQRGPFDLVIEINDLSDVELAIGRDEYPAVDGRFTKRFDLSDGVHQIDIDAVDAAGHRTRLDIQVIVDREAPHLALDCGPDLYTTDSFYTIKGHVTAGDAVAVCGKEVRVAANGAFETRVELNDPRLDSIQVRASDLAGNERTETIRVIRDSTPPQVTTITAMDSLTLGRNRLEGTLTDASPCILNVNGFTKRVTTGDWSMDMTLTGDMPFISISAVDAAGNQTTLRRRALRIDQDEGHSTGSTLPVETEGKDLDDGLPKRLIHPRSGIEFALIPAGSYFRGAVSQNPESDFQDVDRERHELPRHLVQLSRPLYVSVYEVTNAQYRRFDPSHSSGSAALRSLDGEDQPAVRVNWNSANDFCEHFGFRLLTEAEWEYVARCNGSSRYPWGDDASDGDGTINVADGTLATFDPERSFRYFKWDDQSVTSAPVGSYEPNEMGLHDVAGNVSEWVQDAFSLSAYSPFELEHAIDPVCTDTDANLNRVIRGGSWRTGTRDSRLSARHFLPESGIDATAEFGLESVGLRVALDVDNR